MRVVLIFIFALFQYSCMTKVSIEMEETSKQIVVNSLLCEGDTAMVSMSYTYPSFGESLSESPILNLVSIHNLKDTFHLYPTNKCNSRCIYKGDFVPLPGVEYRLVIDHNGTALSAVCSVPEPIKIDSFYIVDAIPEYDFDKPIDLKISFTDPPEETNYYMVGFSIYRSSYTYYYDPENDFAEPEFGFVYKEYHFDSEADYGMNISEPLIGDVEFYDPRILCFNDADINGKQYTLTIGLRDVFNYSFTKALLFIPKLYSIDYNAYLYYQSINKASENNESYIAEPIVQYSNINGSLGIFAGMTMTTDTLMLLVQ